MKGKEICNPKSFLKAIKETIESLFKNNSQTKFKMILICMMDRTNIKIGDVVTQAVNFHSHTLR